MPFRVEWNVHKLVGRDRQKHSILLLFSLIFLFLSCDIEYYVDDHIRHVSMLKNVLGSQPLSRITGRFSGSYPWSLVSP